MKTKCLWVWGAEGSSSVQTLGGMSGAIVVEDPEGSLPPEVEAMREVIAVLQETNIESGENETKTVENHEGSGLSVGQRRGRKFCSRISTCIW